MFLVVDHESRWPAIRSGVLFVIGVVGVIHEAFFTTANRPALLVLFAAMMGLPFALAADMFRRNGGAT